VKGLKHGADHSHDQAVRLLHADVDLRGMLESTAFPPPATVRFGGDCREKEARTYRGNGVGWLKIKKP